MADLEFEEFRQHFDKLPQYFKAPSSVYRLVHDIDIGIEEEDKSHKVKNENGPTGVLSSPSCPTQTTQNDQKRVQNQNSHNSSQDSGSTSTSGGSSEDQAEKLNEPFNRDFQVVVPSDSSMITSTSTSTKRRRRRLPELPKHPPGIIFGGHRNGVGHRIDHEKRIVSLAEEMLAADRQNNYQGPSNFYNYNHPQNQNQNNDYNNYKTCTKLPYPNNSTSPNTTTTTNASIASDGNSPVLLLRFNKSGDDESSSDSEKYPSIDSGHSTLHSSTDDRHLYSPYNMPLAINNESYSPTSPSSSICSSSSKCLPFSQLEVLDETHRGLHKFLPRHHDEIEIDIGDPIYMQKEDDDLWCEGVNLRSGRQGIFPSAYVVDRNYNDFDPNENKVKKERYLINYVGSIETLYHKGNEVLCQAVGKITGNEVPPHSRPCILEITDQGIKMVDKSKKSPNNISAQTSRPCQDYFYALKNISFCGFHPTDNRYFGFVTKHPSHNRFACHVFVSEQSSRPVAEAVGRAFQRFYQKFLETAYPIEDIYLDISLRRTSRKNNEANKNNIFRRLSTWLAGFCPEMGI